MRQWVLDSKTRQQSTTAVDTTVPSLAKETRGSLTAGRTYSDKESRKDKHSDSMPKLIGLVCISQPIYHGCRLRKQKLL